MRQVVLDTETTGLETRDDHRILEIGCLELERRRPTGRTLHLYLNPEREIDEEALRVHGISQEFLADKPTFPEVADQVMAFLEGAELVIHNAPFDVGFLNHELKRMAWGSRIEDHSSILDTLQLAKRMHPGQRNSLDALCRRYGIDNSQRELHGALLDAQLLADVYLLMTGGQTALFQSDSADHKGNADTEQKRTVERLHSKLLTASPEEKQRHGAYLQALRDQGKTVIWK